MKLSRGIKIFALTVIGLGILMMPIYSVYANPAGMASAAASRVPNDVNSGAGAQELQLNTCGPVKFFTDFHNCIKWAGASIVYLILQIAFWFMRIAAELLQVSIDKTIVNMSSLMRNMTGINVAWSVVRDVANMTFIFILLYAAIGTVLQLSSANAGKTIKNIVIAALLINFSMFFTKVAIDASNIVTIGFYDAIVSSEQLGAGEGNPGRNLGSVFQRQLGISSIYGGQESLVLIRNGNPTAIIITLAAGVVLALVGAFIFATIAFMLLMRFVVLIFLIILSPLAFVGSVIPGIGQYSSKWTKTLSGQLLFAPVYMLMTWITLRVMTGTSGIPGSFGFSNAGNAAKFASIYNGGDAVALIMNYIVVIMFLVGTLVVSKGFATAGGGVVGSMMNRTSKWAGATMFGGAAIAGRNTFGRFGARAANDEELKEKAKTSRWANLRLRAYNKMGGSSFDARSYKKVGGVAKSLGLGDVGQVNKKKEGGILGIRKAKDTAYVEKQKKIGEMLAPSDFAVQKADTKAKDFEKKFNADLNKTPEGKEVIRKYEVATKELAEYDESTKTRRKELIKQAKQAKLPEMKQQLQAEINKIDSEKTAKAQAVRAAEQAKQSYSESLPSYKNFVEAKKVADEIKSTKEGRTRQHEYAESLKKGILLRPLSRRKRLAAVYALHKGEKLKQKGPGPEGVKAMKEWLKDMGELEEKGTEETADASEDGGEKKEAA